MRSTSIATASLLLALLTPPTVAADPGSPPAMLVAAMLAETPLVEDLRYLSNEIGGRATGSAANLRSVEWALERFREAGVDARREAFRMPGLWRELSAPPPFTTS